MSLNFLQKFIFTVLLIYVLISFYTFSKGHAEIYPVFSWDLFSSVPGVDERYFLKVGGVVLYGPEITNYLEIDYPPEYFFEIQGLGRQFETTKDAALFSEIEGKFITRPIFYELVRVEYNPVRFVTTGEVINEEVIGRFDVK